MQTRPYERETDRDHVVTIWREAGWIDDDDHAQHVERFYDGGQAVVAPASGQFEAVGHWSSGTYRWMDHDLPVAAITGILTGRAGRRQGLATDVVNESLAAAHDAGCALAVLGAFEQGFYNRFGFASDTYEHRLTFDPNTLTVDYPTRAPVRIGPADHAEFYELLRRRERHHGGMFLEPPELIEAEWGFISKWFGLGFRDDDGRLTSAIVGMTDDEHGPYHVLWMAYETASELIELLGVLRSLGDQVMLVTMIEPPEVRLQDVIAMPTRQAVRFGLDGGKHRLNRAFSWQQTRILGLEPCIGAISTPYSVGFDLQLTDPLAERGGRWEGIAGTYHVELGAESSVTPIESGDGGVPLLTTDVGNLTRLWTGSRSATQLALLGGLDAPPELMTELDRIFCLPPVNPGINF